MQVIQKFFSGLILIFSFSVLHAQADSVMYQRDSAITADADPTVLFFEQNEKVASPATVSLVTKANKIVKLSAFLKSTGIYADHVLADLDKDGKKDIVLAGNFYSPDFMTGRYDASIGLMLQGDAKGEFKPLSPAVSGIHINGDARALATLKINNKSVVISAVNEGRLQVFMLNR